MMAARISGLGLAVSHDCARNHRLRIGQPGIEPGVVPDEVGLREACRIAEAVRRAGASRRRS